jgi:polyisoprenoid-binding protein YceI
MSTATKTPAAAATTPGLATWTIDPAHSHVEFAVRHMMISTVKGRFGGVAGTVRTDETNPANAQVEVEIDAATIDTRESQRDAHLKSADFFDVEKFPKLIFRSKRITDVSGDSFKLVGDLAMHGVTREVTLDVASEGRGTDPWGNERAGFTAAGKLKRSEFGLTWNQALETGGLLVGDDIKVAIDVELVKVK